MPLSNPPLNQIIPTFQSHMHFPRPQHEVEMRGKMAFLSLLTNFTACLEYKFLT